MADSPGSAFMSGMVSHSGHVGCHLYCNMPSRRCAGNSHYYAAMNLPDNYNINGCCHPDVSDKDLKSFREGLPKKYKENLSCLLAVNTQTDFKALCLALGLTKQMIFSGLLCQLLPVPSLFTMDIMHLSVLNNPNLFIKLFTGELNVYEPDDKADWDWAIFYCRLSLWNTHSETIMQSVLFIPLSFECVP